MDFEELERYLFARYGATATAQTVTTGNAVAEIAGIAIATPANERIPVDERTRRLNNMIAEFMADGASEEEAKTIAREIIDKGRIAPCEASYRQAPIRYQYDDCKPPVGAGYTLYNEDDLTRYFMMEGWTERTAVELSCGMIERGSCLPLDEHMKYLELVSSKQERSERN